MRGTIAMTTDKRGVHRAAQVALVVAALGVVSLALLVALDVVDVSGSLVTALGGLVLVSHLILQGALRRAISRAGEAST